MKRFLPFYRRNREAKSFLEAQWRHLAFANYEVAPEVLEPYLPAGTELDMWNGKCYLSLVAFLFLETKVFGVKVPGHVNFEEVNIRFYVTRFDGTQWKRGVVFVKEIVPRSAIAFIANTLYREKYERLPMRHRFSESDDAKTYEFGWNKHGKWQMFSVDTKKRPMPMKKLIIAAGTGFLGQTLTTHFKERFDEIVILTRGQAKTSGNVRFVHWNAKTFSGWENELENATILINLAGKSVDCRYTEANKREILASRVDSTAILNLAVRTCANPPKHWLNASTATIYRHSTDKQMDEATGEIGDDFSMNVAKAWEAEFFGVDTPKTLKTALRTSIVLGKNGGAFPVLKNLVRLGFGGKQGDGRQFISWIHELDFAQATAFCIENKITGAVNIVSPNPIRNALFMKTLRKTLNVPTGLPLGKRLLAFGAKIIGTETELVLKSRNVIPSRLLENGFRFEFGTLEKALENLTR